MTIDEAIAEVNGTYPPDEPWIAGAFEADGWPHHQALAIAAILNAVASGELVKRALADHGPTAPGQIDG